ncbi:unnamed protein product [marine sediment metagenome]|uniref:Transcription regulator AsnC/Lrp ligand binding domain-containing protein n=1 Tax=marine sediment metagenome TaxID=412755 RepID=X0Z7X2_9ZZZZ
MPTAFVFITTEPAAMVEVLKEVKAVDGVEEAEMVHGVYDIVARVNVDTLDKLKHIISNQIRRINKVKSTQTLLAVPEE